MRYLRSIAALAVVAIVAAACSGGDEDDGNKKNNGKKGGEVETRIVVSAPLEPPTLDLTTTSAAGIPEVLLDNVLEGLVKLDENGKIRAGLAEKYEISKDGLEYTFHLVKAKFHDGTAFDADDVVFTFDRARAPKSTHPFASYFEAVKSIEAVNPQTVKITLSRVSDNFLFYLTQGAGAILNKESINKIAENPVGTGPFEFKEWKHGDSITLVRNENYWGQKPSLKEVVFKYIEEPTAANNALLAGDIDVISRVDAPESLKAFQGKDEFKILEGLTNAETILTMNNAAEPLSDVRVRRAISYAIDRQALIQGARSGYAEPLGSHVPPTDPWYVDLSDYYSYDPQKAKDLLKQAGYGGGLNLRLTLPPTSYAERGGELIADQLAQVGIKTKVESVDFPTWIDQVFTKGDYDLTIIAHVEPRDIIQYGNPDYYWHYDNPQVQKWLKLADEQTDPQKRDQYYEKVERKITEDAVNVWLFLLPAIAVIDAGVEGYKANRVSPAIDMTDVVFRKS